MYFFLEQDFQADRHYHRHSHTIFDLEDLQLVMCNARPREHHGDQSWQRANTVWIDWAQENTG